jgi:hypothetical protein
MSSRAQILTAAAISLVLYAVLAAAGDLKAHVPAFLAAQALLFLLMLVGWRAVERGPAQSVRLALGAAVLFRLVAAAAPPSLSDDVFRYVWDGRVQAAGHHPYRFAPADPERRELRDDAVYPRINHPEIPTIYPPLAEMLFAALASLKLGPIGFKLALALLDVGVIAALMRLLRVLGAPPDRVVLYAWNPLAIVEIAMSGHIEPLGLLFVVIAVAGLIDEKPYRAAAALGAAIQAKLLPLILVPGFVRRLKTRALAVTFAVIAVTTAPYALRGPWYGGGVLAYAERWEHGAVLFDVVRRAYAGADLAPRLTSAITWAQSHFGSADAGLWEVLYRSVWPGDLARITVALAAVAWAIVQSFRPGLDAAHESRLAIGGALLLAPTLHPWYVLWVLPLAVAQAAWSWIILAALVPLGYLAGAADLTWGLRLLILVPAMAWMIRDSLVRSRR